MGLIPFTISWDKGCVKVNRTSPMKEIGFSWTALSLSNEALSLNAFYQHQLIHAVLSPLRFLLVLLKNTSRRIFQAGEIHGN